MARSGRIRLLDGNQGGVAMEAWSLTVCPSSYDSVMNLDDLTRRGLYLSDIPLHDATRDLVLLGEQFREEYKLTQELEILTDRLQLTLRALEDEKKKTDT